MKTEPHVSPTAHHRRSVGTRLTERRQVLRALVSMSAIDERVAYPSGMVARPRETTTTHRPGATTACGWAGEVNDAYDQGCIRHAGPGQRGALQAPRSRRVFQ